ncbi:MAG: DUF3579 domain-containing protein [Gammaproteobacteria bacterium]
MSDHNLVISGRMENGKTFRPSDWIERISSVLASFQIDNRLRYSQGVQPCVIDGEPCLVVARWLEVSDRVAYDFVMDFARSNQLRIQTDRRSGERALSQCPPLRSGPQAARASELADLAVSTGIPTPSEEHGPCPQTP